MSLSQVPHDVSGRPADAGWQQLVDPGKLARWMDGQGLGEGAIHSGEILVGGTQNVLIKFSRGAEIFVLRRPPEHARATSNNTIRREARMLSALATTGVPHPRLIAACPNETVLGTAFYLMDAVDGFNPRYRLPNPHASQPVMRHRMGLALVEGIAQLATLDHTELGLADFGKIDGYLERQTERWSRQLAGYSENTGWPGLRQLDDVQVLKDWLDANRPRSFAAGIVHGDYHLSNVMYRRDSAELAAIVDWELTTVGAPMIDLGWLLATWPRADGTQEPGIIGTAPWDGFPSAEELVVHYEKVTGKPLNSLEWYIVLACYKLGILLEGTYARACAGKAPMDTGERLHSGAVALFARAKHWIRTS